jgi:hypothetical protein
LLASKLNHRRTAEKRDLFLKKGEDPVMNCPKRTVIGSVTFLNGSDFKAFVMSEFVKDEKLLRKAGLKKTDNQFIPDLKGDGQSILVS